MYLGDFKEDGDLFFKFTSRAFATGIPTVLAGSPVLSVFIDENTTGKTTTEAYFDLDVSLGSIVGYNNVRLDLSGDAFFATGGDYSVVITTGTVGGVSVVGETLATFSIENRSMGTPVGATLSDDIQALKAETVLIVADTGELQADDIPGAITALNNITAASVWAVDATGQQTQGTFGQAVGDPGATAKSLWQATVSDAAGVSVSADVIAVKTETALIVGDTNELQLDDVPGLIATVTTDLDDIKGTSFIKDTHSLIDLKTETALIVGDTNELQGDDVPGLIATVTTDLDDIKGTGFVKDTHSLFDIEGYVDLIDDGTSGLAKIATDAAAVLVDTGTTLPDMLQGLVLISKASVGATGNTTTVVHLATGTGSYSDDELNGFFLVLFENGASEYHVREITDWANTGDLATVATLPFTPATDDFYWLLSAQAGSSSAPTASAVADAVWDRDATSNQTGGTFGQAIGDPGANTETMYDAVVTDATGINVATDVVAVKSETALIVADTNELQVDDVPGLIATVTTDLDDIKGTAFAKDTHSLVDIEAYVDILDDGTSGNVKIATDVAATLVDTGTTIPDTLKGLVLISKASVGATGNTTTVVHLATGAGTYADDELNGFFLVLFDNGTSEYHVREVTDWANTGDLATVATLPFTPATDDFYWLLSAQAGSSSAPTASTVADAVWDRDATSNQTTGTFGKAIGDPAANTETIYDAVVTDATGINVATDVVAVKAETALIVADTNELQTDNVPGLIATAQTDLNTITGAAGVVIDDSAANDTTMSDAIWDEDATGHQTQGTFGQAIGDPAADATTIYQSVATDATGDNVAVDVVAVKAETALIVADTNELQTDNVPGLIATAQADLDTITGAAGAIVDSGAATVTVLSDAVWDEDATGHQTGGTFGQAIGDPAANTETIYDAVVTDATGINVATDVVAVKAETVLILDDTDLIDDGTSGLAKIATDVAATLVDTAVIGAAGAGLTDLGGMATGMKAEILVEANAALDTAISELGVAAPAITPTVRTALMLMYMALRNKLVVQTSGTDALEIHNDAGTKITQKLLTDDGSDYTEAKTS